MPYICSHYNMTSCSCCHDVCSLHLERGQSGVLWGGVYAWYSMIYLSNAGLAVMLYLPDRCLLGGVARGVLC